MCRDIKLKHTLLSRIHEETVKAEQEKTSLMQAKPQVTLVNFYKSKSILSCSSSAISSRLETPAELCISDIIFLSMPDVQNLDMQY